MRRALVALTAGGLVLAGVAGPALATPGGGSELVFSTSDRQFDRGIDNQGWWSANVANSDANENYSAGFFAGRLYRDFFTFDLRSLRGTVVAARLSVRVFGMSG